MRGTKGGSLEPITAMLFLILGAVGRKGILGEVGRNGIFIFPVLRDFKKAMLLDRLISYIARSQTNNKRR